MNRWHQLNRTSQIVLILLIAGALVYAGFRLYDYYRDDSLLNRIVDRDGYSLSMKDRPITVDFAIKAEWLPGEGDTERALNVPVGYEHHTLFVLDKITKNGSGLFFNFKELPELNKSNGEFLYTYEINDNGKLTSYSPEGIWKFYKPAADGTAEAVQYGSGQGPDTEFSFSVGGDELAKLGQDGFTAAYSGLILYTYTSDHQ